MSATPFFLRNICISQAAL